MKTADILVLTALKAELDAFREQLGVDWQKNEDRREQPYFVADWRGRVVLAAWATRTGHEATVHRLRDMLEDYTVPVVAMCGICAGAPGTTHLGEVIIADRVYDYSTGKHTAAGFAPDVLTFNLVDAWLQHAQVLAAATELWAETLPERPPSPSELGERFIVALSEGMRLSFKSSGVSRPLWQAAWSRLEDLELIERSSGRPALTESGRRQADTLDFDGLTERPPLRAHIGAIASGPVVRADGSVFDEIQRHQRGVLGIDMEAAAVGRAAQARGLRFIVVKGVSDFADRFKSDVFHHFSMRASATFLQAFLDDRIKSRDPIDESTPPTATTVVTRPTTTFAAATAMRPVPPVPLEPLRDACINRGLDRHLLLSWLPPQLAARLPVKGNYFDQIKSDLETLARSPRLEEGTHPLAIWLKQAADLTGKYFPEYRLFDEARQAVSGTVERFVVTLLTADTDNDRRLHTDHVEHLIQSELRATGQTKRFVLECLSAARADDIRTVLQRADPHILQIFAHGKPEGLQMHGARIGDIDFVDTETLAGLIGASAKHNLKIVILTGCRTAEIATRLSREVPLAIGSTPNAPSQVGTLTAFTVGFHTSLAMGSTVGEAIEQGEAAVVAQYRKSRAYARLMSPAHAPDQAGIMQWRPLPSTGRV